MLETNQTEMTQARLEECMDKITEWVAHDPDVKVEAVVQRLQLQLGLSRIQAMLVLRTYMVTR